MRATVCSNTSGSQVAISWLLQDECGDGSGVFIPATHELPVFHHLHDFCVERVQAFQALAGFVPPCKLLVKSALVDEYLHVPAVIYEIFEIRSKNIKNQRKID